MKRITNIKWLKAMSIRAVKTAAQAFIGACGTTAVIQDIDWRVVLGTTAMAALLSFVTSLAGLPEVDEGGEH